MVISQYYPKVSRESSLDSAGTSVNGDDQEEDVFADLDLTQEELCQATQSFDLFNDNQDEEEAQHAPEPIDFSQVEVLAQAVDEEEPSSKRFRGPINYYSTMKDTPNKWYLDTGSGIRVFKREYR